MVPDRQGNWQVVSGNEIAALLTHFKLQQLAAGGQLPASPIVIRTDVTTAQVTRIARHFGAQVVDNLLVGFKYIADVLWQLERDGACEDVRGGPDDFVIGVEESHGILVTPQMRDKDAGAAALLLAELVLEEKRRGRTVVDYLDRLARAFGYFCNAGIPVFMRGIQGRQLMGQMLDRLRTEPLREVAGLAVTDFEDLRDPAGRLGPIKGATDAAARNVLNFRLGDCARVTLRPSGTEPKAKIYLEAWSAPCPRDASPDVWRETCSRVTQVLQRVSDDFVRQVLARVGLQPAATGTA
jgi:phosphoglucomutase/phosphomannomutase